MPLPFQVVLGRGCTADTIHECIPALFRALKEQGVDLAALMQPQVVAPPQPQVVAPPQPQVVAPPQPQVVAPPQQVVAPPQQVVARPSQGPSGTVKGPWELAYNAPEGFGASLRLTADQDAALAGCPPAMIVRIRESLAEYCIKAGGKNGQLRPVVAVVGDEYEIVGGTGTAERSPSPGDGVVADGDAAAGAAGW